MQIQANAILNMSLVELQQFIETEAMENPALSIEESARCPVCGFLTGVACLSGVRRIDERGTRNDQHHAQSNERDYLDRAFAAAGEDTTFDPFRTVATAMDIRDYLKQQARMSLSGRLLRIADYLIDSLDDDGFFRESLYETAEEFATAVPEIESVLAVIQSFDPPGIAARDLRESLLIQLRALGADGAVAADAERILAEHWEDFSRMRLKSIAKKLETTLGAVQEAC